MNRRPKNVDRDTIPIRHALDIKLGDMLFSNVEPTIYIVARAEQRFDILSKKTIFFFTLVSSDTGKVYDVPEGLIGVIRMRKLRMTNDESTKAQLETSRVFAEILGGESQS